MPLHIVCEAGQRQEIYTSVRELYLDKKRIDGNIISRDALIREKGARREIRAVL